MDGNVQQKIVQKQLKQQLKQALLLTENTLLAPGRHLSLTRLIFGTKQATSVSRLQANNPLEPPSRGSGCLLAVPDTRCCHEISVS